MQLLSARLRFPEVIVALAALIVTGWFLYAPGLSGGMLFDDLPNLVPIGDNGGITDWTSLLAFLFSSDYLPGRPLSLLTFVMDDPGWPSDSPTLKRTNLLLHLCNAMLILWFVYLVLLRVFGEDKDESAASAFRWACVIALFWMINPFQVSTVSYIIQRMAELSALFSLLALIGYLKLRPKLERHFSPTLCILTIWILLCYLLGVLCKENTLLLGLQLLLVEWMCFKRTQVQSCSPRQRLVWALWCFAAFWGPYLLFLLYWLWQSSVFTRGFEGREFTLAQRLMTEPRIIWDYIAGIFIPRISTNGLFNDALVVSTGLLRPASTFMALLAMAGLVLLAWRVRARIPLFSFGVAFYLVGHLLESTFLPLELYFEHRNYLPQVGLWVALAGLILAVRERRPGVFPALQILFVPYLALALFITYQTVTIWGSNQELAEHWYRSNPRSIRSIQFVARERLMQGGIDDAIPVIRAGFASSPGSAALYLSWTYLECSQGKNVMDLEKAKGLLGTIPMESAVLEVIDLYRRLLESGQACSSLNYPVLQELVTALLNNPRFTFDHRSHSSLYVQMAKIGFSRRNLNLTISSFDRACNFDCSAEIRWQQALLLSSAGLHVDAWRYLEQAEDLLQSSLTRLREPLMIKRVAELRRTLELARRGSDQHG